MRVLEITGVDGGRASTGLAPKSAAHRAPVGVLASVAWPVLRQSSKPVPAGCRASAAVSLLVKACPIACSLVLIVALDAIVREQVSPPVG